MKNLTHLLFVLLCICLPVAVHAQKDKDKDDDDSKYLAGAVPEVDGKVVFTKEFSIPGMSQEENGLYSAQVHSHWTVQRYSTNCPWFVHPRSVQWKLKRFVSITVKEKRSIQQRNGS